MQTGKPADDPLTKVYVVYETVDWPMLSERDRDRAITRVELAAGEDGYHVPSEDPGRCRWDEDRGAFAFEWLARRGPR